MDQSLEQMAGSILVESRLTGNPDLLLKFLNGNIMDDVSFHPCVRLSKYDREGVISFVPPDGKFKLLDFRSKGNIPLPINIVPTIFFSRKWRNFQTRSYSKKYSR